MYNDEFIIDLPVDYSFDVPAGLYAAKFHNIKPKPDSNGEQVRLLFEVFVPGSSRTKRYLAGRNFPRGSRQLRQFLEQWLGDKLMDGAVDDKPDMRAHFGRPAELIITHHINKNYEKPFVLIEAIHPPGSLTLTGLPSRPHEPDQGNTYADRKVEQAKPVSLFDPTRFAAQLESREREPQQLHQPKNN